MRVNPLDPIFYVYVYLDPRKPGKYVYGEYSFDYEPFYIGEGHGKRAYKHLRGNKNKDFFNRIQEIITPLIIFYKKEVDNYTALRLEGKLTRAIGRLNKGTGSLYNLVEGGGSGGMVGRVCTEETKRKMSIAKQNMSNETKEKIRKANIGIKHTEEQKRKTSESLTGKRRTEEQKQKMSTARQNMSDDTRKKLSESSKGKKMSDEAKRKMSLAKRKWNDEILEDIKVMLNKNFTQKEIGNKLNVDQSVISRWIKNLI